MENASKALIMAGSVLISLIVISLLVASFTSLKGMQQTQKSVTREEQIAEFNNQYEVYARNLYGSEILSLINKINNYNKTEAENEGYTKIEISIKINNDLNRNYFRKGTYTSTTFENELNKVNAKVEELGNERIYATSVYSRLISQLATMRTTDAESLGFLPDQYQSKVAEYNTYKNLAEQIKTKMFKYESFEHDENTGRVIKMNYSL